MDEHNSDTEDLGMSNISGTGNMHIFESDNITCHQEAKDGPMFDVDHSDTNRLSTSSKFDIPQSFNDQLASHILMKTSESSNKVKPALSDESCTTESVQDSAAGKYLIIDGKLIDKQKIYNLHDQQCDETLSDFPDKEMSQQDNELRTSETHVGINEKSEAIGCCIPTTVSTLLSQTSISSKGNSLTTVPDVSPLLHISNDSMSSLLDHNEEDDSCSDTSVMNIQQKTEENNDDVRTKTVNKLSENTHVDVNDSKSPSITSSEFQPIILDVRGGYCDVDTDDESENNLDSRENNLDKSTDFMNFVDTSYSQPAFDLLKTVVKAASTFNKKTSEDVSSQTSNTSSHDVSLHLTPTSADGAQETNVNSTSIESHNLQVPSLHSNTSPALSTNAEVHLKGRNQQISLSEMESVPDNYKAPTLETRKRLLNGKSKSTNLSQVLPNVLSNSKGALSCVLLPNKANQKDGQVQLAFFIPQSTVSGGTKSDNIPRFDLLKSPVNAVNQINANAVTQISSKAVCQTSTNAVTQTSTKALGQIITNAVSKKITNAVSRISSNVVSQITTNAVTQTSTKAFGQKITNAISRINTNAVLNGQTCSPPHLQEINSPMSAIESITRLVTNTVNSFHVCGWDLINTDILELTPFNEADYLDYNIGCSVCGEFFHYSDGFDFHLQRTVFHLTYFCLHCNKSLDFFNKCSLWAHLKSESEKPELNYRNIMCFKPYEFDDVDISKSRQSKTVMKHISLKSSAEAGFIMKVLNSRNSQSSVTLHSGNVQSSATINSGNLHFNTTLSSGNIVSSIVTKQGNLSSNSVSSSRNLLPSTVPSNKNLQFCVASDSLNLSYSTALSSDSSLSSTARYGSLPTSTVANSSSLPSGSVTNSGSLQSSVTNSGSLQSFVTNSGDLPSNTSHIETVQATKSQHQKPGSKSSIANSGDLLSSHSANSGNLLSNFAQTETVVGKKTVDDSTISELATHASRTYTTYKCSVCCTFVPNLAAHLCKTGHGKLLCTICGMYLPSICARKAHVRIHMGVVKKISCPECGKSDFSTKEKGGDLRAVFDHVDGCRHFNRKLDLKCFCNLQVNNVNKLLKHFLERHCKTLFKCPLCILAFTENHHLVGHLVKSHAISISPSASVLCLFCQQIIKSANDLKLHVYEHANLFKDDAGYKWKCFICSKLFFERSALNYHLEKDHPHKSNRCTICFSLFLSRKNLVEHIVQKQCLRHMAQKLNYCIDNETEAAEHAVENVSFGELFKPKIASTVTSTIHEETGQSKTELSGNKYFVKIAPKPTGQFNANNSNNQSNQNSLQLQPADCDKNKTQVLTSDNSCSKQSSSKKSYKLIITKGNESTEPSKQAKVTSYINQCVVCKKLIVADKLQEHLKYHQSQGSKVCSICQRTNFTTMEDVMKHSETCSNKKLQNSLERQRARSSEMSVETNVSQEDVEDLEQQSTDTDGTNLGNPSVFPCLLCGLAFQSLSSREEHVSRLHDGTRTVYHCNVCRKKGKTRRFIKKQLAAKHIIKKHRIVNMESVNRLIRTEEQNVSSGQNLPASQLLVEEAASSTPPKRLRVAGEGDYLCGKCGFSSCSSDSFSEHITSHNSAQEPQCPECGLCFTILQALKKHLLAVHKIREVDNYLKIKNINETEVEEETFNTVLEVYPFSNIQSDSRDAKPSTKKHTSNPLECTVCYKVFDKEANLKKHMRNHGMAFIKSKRHKR